MRLKYFASLATISLSPNLCSAIALKDFNENQPSGYEIPELAQTETET